MDNVKGKPLMRVLAGEAVSPPPIWLMRQAGRYLPEYRKLRASCDGFLDLCYRPELAAEATLQPIRRFAFDAAIIFSDILVLPHALGQDVWFVEGEGPKLAPLRDARDILALQKELDEEKISAVCTALTMVKTSLPADVALIGFCGAPWTLATYMVTGEGSQDHVVARSWAYQSPESFAGLIDRLSRACIKYLCAQIDAGADAVQIFDSWAGILPPDELVKWSVKPIAAICAGVKSYAPDVPIIIFPRDVGSNLAYYNRIDGVAAISVDWMQRIDSAVRVLGNDIACQGNLDPIVLLNGNTALDDAVDAILSATAGRPFIFNLGHGILPNTPISHVEQLIARVRGYRGD